jgi:high-affinity iron transporter
MIIVLRLCRSTALLFLALAALFGPARAQGSSPETVWRLLDYMAVDYGGAVQDGRVVNEAEYREMIEFAAQVRTRLAELPNVSSRGGLITEAQRLEAAIRAKDRPANVSAAARHLAASVLAAYPVALGPPSAPDVARGAQLYAENCASCHGAGGNGAGPAARGMDPPPIDFTDRARARERSVFALYQVVNQGLEGTAMQSFAHLPAQDQWALAFHVSRLAYPEAEAGERLWREQPGLRAQIPNLAVLAGMTPAELSRAIGEDRAVATLAYLRANPAAVAGPSGTGVSLALVRERLAESLRAFEAGDAARARDLALSAYLDGFEPVEPLLRARDAALMGRVETAMMALRASISRGAQPGEVAAQIRELNRLLDEAEAALAPDRASDASSFLGAFTILLREGLEALLVVIAMIAFLRKAERTDVLPYVHGGWAAALVAGLLTWALATYVIGVSGASRELTEGFGSLLAALVLLSVGIWMHGKSKADAWQRYIREKMTAVLSRRSAWFLFGLTFIVVYREVFETILFYAALWTQGHGGAILGGALSAAALLAVVAWVMLRYSRRLPIGTFFAYSSALMAVLAVVLAGKGVAALQEAGLIETSPLAAVPQISILGLFPSVQGLAAQALTIAAIALGFWFNSRKTRPSPAPERRPQP